MEPKSIYKSKTFWMALATIMSGIGMYVSGEQELQELLVAVIGAVFGVSIWLFPNLYENDTTWETFKPVFSF